MTISNDVFCIREVDSDGDEVDQLAPDDPLNGYRVWYSVDVEVEPPPPQTSLTISCNCQVSNYCQVNYVS